MCRNYRSPCSQSPCCATREATAVRSPRSSTKSSPRSPQLEKAKKKKKHRTSRDIKPSRKTAGAPLPEQAHVTTPLLQRPREQRELGAHWDHCSLYLLSAWAPPGLRGELPIWFQLSTTSVTRLQLVLMCPFLSVLQDCSTSPSWGPLETSSLDHPLSPPLVLASERPRQTLFHYLL